MQELRVLLVDDHEVVRLGLRSLIDRHEGLKVVGEAANAAEAVAQALQLRPDVVVLDIRLPGRSGIEACRDIKAKSPRTKIVILTSFPDDESLIEAIAAGADGYVLKQIGSDELVRALERAGQGESLLDPALTGKIFAKVREARRRERGEAFAALNERELHILALLAEGRTNADIGRTLHFSEKTVRNYVSDILGKLGLTSRAQAAAYAARHRIEDHLS